MSMQCFSLESLLVLPAKNGDWIMDKTNPTKTITHDMSVQIAPANCGRTLPGLNMSKTLELVDQNQHSPPSLVFEKHRHSVTTRKTRSSERTGLQVVLIGHPVQIIIVDLKTSPVRRYGRDNALHPNNPNPKGQNLY